MPLNFVSCGNKFYILTTKWLITLHISSSNSLSWLLLPSPSRGDPFSHWSVNSNSFVMIQQRSYVWNFNNNTNPVNPLLLKKRKEKDHSFFLLRCHLSHSRNRTLRTFPLWPNLRGGMAMNSQRACDDSLFHYRGKHVAPTRHNETARHRTWPWWVRFRISLF